MAKSPVTFYLLPSTYLGQLVNDGSGTFKGNIPIPPGIAPGRYTMQMNGFVPSGAIRSLSIGVIVTATAPTKRKAAMVFFAPLSATITDAGRGQLRILAKAVRTGAVRVVSIGFVQPTARMDDDESLSTQRARNVAAFLRSLGVGGTYVVRGDGVAKERVATARRVNVTVTYRR